MSDFPRGWTLTAFGVGAAATITVPAIPGVVHVLDSFSAKLTNNGGAAVGDPVQLSSSDGVYSSFQIGQLLISATAESVDTDSASDLDLPAGPGASLTITIPNPGVSNQVFLRVQGHDI